MKRYLLFDSGCSLCSKLAQDIEGVADGWLIARSLRDTAMQALLDEARPGWRWQPTLLEIKDDKINVFTGAALMAKIVQGLGMRRAWRLTKLIQQVYSASNHINMGRRQFLQHGGVLLAALPLLGMPGLRPRFPAKETTSFQGNTFWKYSDPDYDFSLEYPAGWYVEARRKQTAPYSVLQSIIKRITFFTPNGLVDIDMWALQGQDFQTWLHEYAETRNMAEILNTASTEATGQTTNVFVLHGRTDLYTVFFSDGAYVYRLWNLVPGNTPALGGFWHMLDTFTLPGVVSTEASIPEGFRQLSGLTGDNTPSENSCCEYTCVGNPFPCCANGNCTWWVYYCYCGSGGVPFRGDAHLWWGQVVDHYTEWERGYTPKPNIHNICWWPVSGLRPYGHVAFAAGYQSGSGTIAVSDMGCDDIWDCVRNRNISISDPGGYIRRCTICPTLADG
jgi:hypothetical protein